MRIIHLLAPLLVTLTLAAPAHAVQPGEQMKDPALEGRARALSSELRCLVCQNQSIDDSEAGLARDLRVIVRERLQAGDDDASVRAYLVRRYGDFVLLKPPFKPATLLLWGTPILILLGGGFALLRGMRRSQSRTDAVALDDHERAALGAMLERRDV